MSFINYVTQIQIDFGAIQLLQQECDRVGMKRPLIVTDAGVKAAGILQKALDALPGVALKGTVESFAPGSGSQFSLLPFEPGTGNFTKIVQRVPVRIRFEPGQPGLDHLRPGLSTTVKVELK